MAIFASSGKSSKRTTPRGSGNIFTTSTPSQTSQSVRTHSSSSFSATTSFAPEKTGDTISPSVTLAPMEASNKPPAGRYTEKGCLLDKKPESMVAESLRMKGELEFTRLLRVDGRFEGNLITDRGSLVVGPKGEVIGDLKNMQEVYVEGVVRGNVFASDVKVKNNGMLFGDIQCLCLTLDPTASIKGVADTATLKERAILEANPAPPSASSTAGGPAPTAAAAAATAASAALAASSTKEPLPSSAPPAPPASAPTTPPAMAAAAPLVAAGAASVGVGDEPSAAVETPVEAVAPAMASAEADVVAKPSPAVEDTVASPGAAPSPSS